MNMQEQMDNLNGVMDNLSDCIPVEDKELLQAIKTLKIVERFIYNLGPFYHFFRVRMYDELQRMESCAQARDLKF
jgi:hypothetical protein